MMIPEAVSAQCRNCLKIELASLPGIGGKSAQRHRYDLDGFVLRCGVGCIFRDSDSHKLFSQKIRRFWLMQTAWCGKLFYICSIFTGQFYLLISAMLILNLLNEVMPKLNIDQKTIMGLFPESRANFSNFFQKLRHSYGRMRWRIPVLAHCARLFIRRWRMW